MQIKIFLSLIIVIISLNSMASYSQSLSKAIISLTGKVISSNVNIKPNVKVTIYNDQNKKIASTQTLESSEYIFFDGVLKPKSNYNIVIEGKGFFTQEIPFETPNSEQYLELSKDFVVQPMEIGTRILIKFVPFDKNKSLIRNGSDYIFENYVNLLKKNLRARFEIISYPDDNVDKDFNKNLTQLRANAIKDDFVSAGILDLRLKAKG